MIIPEIPWYYAGVGSRETPEDVLQLMRQFAIKLANLGWVLRSGGAPGADSAFEAGCKEVQGRMSIFLPWKGFEDRPNQEGYHSLDYIGG